jgi:hypothetical protein
MVALFLNIMIKKLNETIEWHCTQLELNSNSIEEKQDANWCTKVYVYHFHHI